MNKNTFVAKYGGIIAILIGIGLIIVSVVMISNSKVYARTSAIVTSCIDDSDFETTSFRTEFKYVADGKTYESSSSSSDYYNVGDLIEIYYDRSDPSRTMDKKSVDTAFIPIGIGILFIAVGALITVKYYKPELIPNWIRIGE